MITCMKCRKEFMYESNLKKHLNQHTPCDLIVVCDICDMKFKSLRNLNNHKLKTIPCIRKNNDYEDKKIQNQLLLEQLKETTKLKLADKKLEIEDKKTKRKEITAKLVNDRLEQSKKVADDAKLLFIKTTRDSIMKQLERYISISLPLYDGKKNMSIDILRRDRQFYTDLTEVYNDTDSIMDLNKGIFTLIFTNDKFKNVFYNAQLDEYYAIGYKTGRIRVIHTKYNEHIEPIIKPILIQVYQMISSQYNNPNWPGLEYDTPKFKKLMNFRNIISSKSIEQYNYIDIQALIPDEEYNNEETGFDNIEDDRGSSITDSTKANKTQFVKIEKLYIQQQFTDVIQLPEPGLT